jgi:hypothetical protein
MKGGGHIVAPLWTASLEGRNPALYNVLRPCVFLLVSFQDHQSLILSFSHSFPFRSLFTLLQFIPEQVSTLTYILCTSLAANWPPSVVHTLQNEDRTDPQLLFSSGHGHSLAHRHPSGPGGPSRALPRAILDDRPSILADEQS